MNAARESDRGGSEVRETWPQAINAWTNWLAASGRPPTTIRLRRWHLRRLAETYLDRRPWRLGVDELAAFLREQHWSPETLKSGRASIRSFYRWAELTGRIRRNPAATLPGVPVPRGVPRPVGEQLIEAALDRANDRVRLMILLAAYAGLRVGEIARLRLPDVVGDRLRVRGKGGKGRLVPIHPRLADQLRAELVRRERGEAGSGWRYRAGLDRLLFPGRYGRGVTPAAVSRVVSAALGDQATAHQLRHRFASRGYARTRDLRAVQELLGHSRPETTARYTDVPDGALDRVVRSL
jgi:integrase